MNQLGALNHQVGLPERDSGSTSVREQLELVDLVKQRVLAHPAQYFVHLAGDD